MALLPNNTVILIDRQKFTLKVMRRGLLTNKFETEKTYSIAVGAEGFATPRGLFDVRRRAKHPDWQIPNSDWARELGLVPGTIVKGDHPRNPIRERWIEIYDGAGIHGTLSSESIGTRASHGCIRMRPEDVIELYPKVRKGTLVHIV